MKYLRIYFLILFALFNQHLLGADAPTFKFGYYIVHLPRVLHVKVEKIRQPHIKFRIIEDFKNDNLSGKKIDTYISKSCFKDSLTLLDIFSPNNEYMIFINGLKKNRDRKKYYLRENANSFIIKNDSLFIHDLFLENLPGKDTIYTIQPNSFGDELFKNGFKISLSYFREIVYQLNQSFIRQTHPTYEINNYYRPSVFRQKRTKIYGYEYKESLSTDPFILALINELYQAWGLCKGTPVNAVD